ncbi:MULTISPECIES: nucleoside triphosphate pyrophosphohydrolase [Hyphomonas]|uniref:Nucleoside triphosphate pyrophosphohydrolase n=1 Tax=Hyphomonas adhaerens TaxID=81029 RepID=A0A3B9H0D3_9PROT|nr:MULTISPECIES: nucleoside triphosphate pyrophosphohydrolase [Hyphomonas]MBB38717.1 nucleoside triphosphate pyrophosphohydrolase [Hyphomonas sp.]HAE28159.1 nucleoside triphosphate pyrophosphohydrolase [Hyphomonas adhaerens]|tara:strand:+ start:708 stop:1541 length:834 start_codon:yes stop_codon:yes gene_type:complete
MDRSDPSPHQRAAKEFVRLLDIMARLRSPDGGCPWDLEQTFHSIAPYTIEEAYEVADAIERGNMNDLREELGDLLFQVAFHSQMAAEEGTFEAADVAAAINEKMVRRHPHVFETTDNRTADDQIVAWEIVKAEERAAKAQGEDAASALDGVALSLPALLRAEKLQKRAARTGFDWTEAEQIFDKLDEETAEVKEAIASGEEDAIMDEVGDLLFVAANLARRLNIDPEVALRQANAKFERRFRAMESLAADRGKDFASLDLDAQESLWKAVKKTETPT